MKGSSPDVLVARSSDADGHPVLTQMDISTTDVGADPVLTQMNSRSAFPRSNSPEGHPEDSPHEELSLIAPN